MSRPLRSDWAEIERAYLANEGSFSALALRFHVSRRQVAYKAMAGAWTAKRAARAPHSLSEARQGPVAPPVEVPAPAEREVPLIKATAVAPAPPEPVAAEPPESVTVPADDEPTWILRAGDRYAVAALQHMASQLELTGGDRAVVLAARATAQAMIAWSRRHKQMKLTSHERE